MRSIDFLQDAAAEVCTGSYRFERTGAMCQEFKIKASKARDLEINKPQGSVTKTQVEKVTKGKRRVNERKTPRNNPVGNVNGQTLGEI